MRDQGEYLTQAEKETLENGALRQQAKTIEAYLTLAALTAMSEPKIEQGIEAIRNTNKKDANKLRKGLMQAMETLEGILSGSDDLYMTEVVEVEKTISEPAIEEPEMYDTRPEIVERLVEPLVRPTELTPGRLELLSVSEQTMDVTFLNKIVDLSQVEGFEDHSISTIASTILEMAGNPLARRNRAGYLPDLLVRMEQRLSGVSVIDIAQQEQTSKGSVEQWFFGIQSKAKSAFGVSATAVFNELLSQRARDISEKNVQKSVDEIFEKRQDEDDIDFLSEDEPDGRVELLKGVYDSDHVIQSFADIMGDISSEDHESLGVWLSADMRKSPPNGMRDSSLHSLVDRIIPLLPRQLDDMGVSGNEKVALRKLFGLYNQNGLPVYRTPVPISIQAQDREYMQKRNVRESLASGVGKMLNYLETQPSTVVTELPEQVASAEVMSTQKFRQILRKQVEPGGERISRDEWLEAAQEHVPHILKNYFSEQKADILWRRVHFDGFDGQLYEDTPLTSALNELEQLFVSKNGSETKISDLSSSMFKMFFMTFQGPQSLNVIHAKFSARHPELGITKDMVEQAVVGELSELLCRD